MPREHEPETGGLVGAAIRISRRVGRKHGDPKSIRKTREVMYNVREAKRAAFVGGFMDEISKIAQVPQIAQPPMPKLTEQKVFQTGTAFQRGQREKSIKQMAMSAPLTKIST